MAVTTFLRNKFTDFTVLNNILLEHVFFVVFNSWLKASVIFQSSQTTVYAYTNAPVVASFDFTTIVKDVYLVMSVAFSA